MDVIKSENQIIKTKKDLENIENDNYWDNGFYLGYNKYEKIT
ncbi:hypothetical protein [Spiroplasma kunkelii]|nr:hypothetical protein [Spiroplasma kunkelii]